MIYINDQDKIGRDNILLLGVGIADLKMISDENIKNNYSRIFR